MSNLQKQCMSLLSLYLLLGLLVNVCQVLLMNAEGGTALTSHQHLLSSDMEGSPRGRQKRVPSPGRRYPMFPFFRKPSFDPSTPKNITTQLGQTVYLHCIVHNLGDKMVSWIRRRDFHVLTVGLTTYTAEDRFQASHTERSDDWMLQIRMAQLSDAGMYECQVNTHPLISLFVVLTVVVPKASIREAPDLYVKTGSSINLTCVISQSPDPPAFVFWYHNDRMINYDPTRGEITVQKSGNDTAISKLFITRAQVSDSGNYTCCPSNTDATSINVHVLNGEKRAAMQHDLNSSPSTNSADSITLCGLLVITLPTVLLTWS